MPLDSGVTIPNLSLIFVVPVIIAGVGLGLGPSLFSAILGALAYNFFLTEPRYTLAVNDPADIWGIGLLFVVGLIVSGVAFTSRRRAIDAALLRRQAAVLQGYNRDVVVADSTKVIVSITSQALAELFRVPVVVMLVADGADLFETALTTAQGLLIDYMIVPSSKSDCIVRRLRDNRSRAMKGAPTVRLIEETRNADVTGIRQSVLAQGTADAPGGFAVGNAWIRFAHAQRHVATARAQHGEGNGKALHSRAAQRRPVAIGHL